MPPRQAQAQGREARAAAHRERDEALQRAAEDELATLFGPGGAGAEGEDEVDEEKALLAQLKRLGAGDSDEALLAGINAIGDEDDCTSDLLAAIHAMEDGAMDDTERELLAELGELPGGDSELQLPLLQREAALKAECVRLKRDGELDAAKASLRRLKALRQEMEGVRAHIDASKRAAVEAKRAGDLQQAREQLRRMKALKAQLEGPAVPAPAGAAPQSGKATAAAGRDAPQMVTPPAVGVAPQPQSVDAASGRDAPQKAPSTIRRAKELEAVAAQARRAAVEAKRAGDLDQAREQLRRMKAAKAEAEQLRGAGTSAGAEARGAATDALADAMAALRSADAALGFDANGAPLVGAHEDFDA